MYTAEAAAAVRPRPCATQPAPAPAPGQSALCAANNAFYAPASRTFRGVRSRFLSHDNHPGGGGGGGGGSTVVTFGCVCADAAAAGPHVRACAVYQHVMSKRVDFVRKI